MVVIIDLLHVCNTAKIRDRRFWFITCRRNRRKETINLDIENLV